MAGDGSDRPQLWGGCGGRSEGVDVFGDGFGDWVSAGLCEVVHQRSGVIGEGVEFYNRKVPFSERASLIEEDGRRVLRVLDRLDGLVATE